MISGMVWVNKCCLWLVNDCHEYHRPIITNVCTPKQSQRPKLVPILPKELETFRLQNEVDYEYEI